MKKMILSLLAIALAAPVMASEPAELNSLGLGGLSVVSEESGMEVRGLSSSVYSSGLSAIRLFVIDPTTGSTFNANASNYSSGADDGTTVDISDIAAATTAGFDTLAVNIGGAAGFDFQIDGNASSAGMGSNATATAARAFDFTYATGGFTFVP